MPEKTDTFSDNNLMLGVKAGDFGKMGLLYERYYRELYRFIFKMTSRKELSEDMVQNVFLRMLKYRKSFAGTGEFRTWMYHIARNTLHDQFRKEKRAPLSNSRPIGDVEVSLSTEPHADDLIEKELDLHNLQSALDSLSVENRELLVLCRFQELKYSEIASLLNTTEGAVKVRIHRAINQLKTNYFEIAKKSSYGMPVL